MDDYGLAAAQESYDRMEPPELNPVLYCDICHEGIYEGERYYKIGGTIMCKCCVAECREFA